MPLQQRPTAPPTIIGATGVTLKPRWPEQAVHFCKSQPADYTPRLYTDGAYRESNFDLHSVFEADVIRKHAAASVVIMHDGIDWKSRPVLWLIITDGDAIDKRSAYTMEYLALGLTTQIQKRSKGTGICSDHGQNYTEATGKP